MGAIQVRISWKWLDWTPGDTWAKNIIPQLSQQGLSEEQLDRCVYVAHANGLFAIKYPKRISPTLYIGEGNFKNRMIQHQYAFFRQTWESCAQNTQYLGSTPVSSHRGIGRFRRGF
jgi:hypothetical protein